MKHRQRKAEQRAWNRYIACIPGQELRKYRKAYETWHRSKGTWPKKPLDKA